MKTYLTESGELLALDWDERGWKTIAVCREGNHFTGLYWITHPSPANERHTRITDADGRERRITEDGDEFFLDGVPLSPLPFDGLPEGATLSNEYERMD